MRPCPPGTAYGSVQRLERVAGQHPLRAIGDADIRLQIRTACIGKGEIGPQRRQNPADPLRGPDRTGRFDDDQIAFGEIFGDRANREMLNVYEATFKANPDKKDLRWRIEHAQHLNAAEIPRFGALGVVASMQGIHATSDAPYVLARLGPARAEEGAYVWQKLMRSGAIVSNGTAVPVERIDPSANYYATVTRKTKDGSVFYGDQKMSREDALKSYTWNAAYAAKEETLKGSLAVGKLADITVLSKNILTVPDDEILSTKVTKTIVGGKLVFGE